MDLPDRSPDAEDLFVAQMSDGDDPEALVQAIEAAMADRRPRLAARLVGLLGDQVEIEPGSELDKAQRAAHLYLFDRQRPEELSWSELEDAWSLARHRRMTRIKRRMRDALNGSSTHRNRLGKPRRGL